MAQTRLLIKTLKKQLKAHGKTYADVAKLLDLSEASVKRLFAEENFTLQRLEMVCESMGLELSDLIQAMVSDRNSVTQLSWDQEEMIVSDLLLLMITVCVINGYAYEDLLAQYEIDPHDCIQKLAALDRLKIIDLLPGNRIKLRVSPDFSWIKKGPIQQLFQSKIEKDFFNSQFDKDTESLIVLNGLLSTRGNLEFQKRMRRLAREFSELCNEDKSLTIDQRHGTSLVIAMRQWQYSLFKAYQK